MEAQAQVKNPFKRKARLGINPLTIEEKGTRYLEITSSNIEFFESKNYPESIKFVHAVDMTTGEEGHFWLAGQLNHQLETLEADRGTLKGLKIEVTHKGKKALTMTIDGKQEKVMVNEFDIFELD